MQAVSRNIAEGQYRLACAEAVANGEPKPGRRPMCFFDPRHGMSVTDVSWAPPDGGPSRLVPVCAMDLRKIEQGIQPEIRRVEDTSGARVPYVNTGFAPAYWGGFGYGGAALGGFLLGEALASPPIFINEYGYGDPGYGTAGTTSAAGTSAETAAGTSAAETSAAETTAAGIWVAGLVAATSAAEAGTSSFVAGRAAGFGFSQGCERRG